MQDATKNKDSASQAKAKARRVRKPERTLVCFLQALEGMRLVVELRQDTIVRGVLESADEEMNLVITSATYTPLQGEKQELDWLYVKGHHIRCSPSLLSPWFSKRFKPFAGSRQSSSHCRAGQTRQEVQRGYPKLGSGHNASQAQIASCRYVHVPSKVDPSRIVEQNKRRIAQLRLLHNRELGSLPALPKGSY